MTENSVKNFQQFKTIINIKSQLYQDFFLKIDAFLFSLVVETQGILIQIDNCLIKTNFINQPPDKTLVYIKSFYSQLKIIVL